MVEGGAVLFGELLRRHRLAFGVTQEALADRARISVAAIGALERGTRRAPHRETVALLADALGLSGAERTEFETAADRARGRRDRPGNEPSAMHNLPARLTSFVNREHEISEISALLKARRLVTLTGSGGVGKTRVALEIARNLLDDEDEVRFVDLSAVADEAFVVGAVAAALNVPLGQVTDAVPSLAAGIRARKLLLILDNCEHLTATCALMASTILQTCPRIVILATSRERLAIEGEIVYRLPSLDVPASTPETVDEAWTYASFRLFMDRATAIESRLALTANRLAALTEICRQLEGIPLAIELAATRLPSLGFTTLNERLRDHFVIATGARDAPQRQRTMLATIAWSYDLLSEPERKLFRRLAVFAGGVTLPAAECVCADDALAGRDIAGLLSLLVDKSLLAANIEGEESRFAMLESVRGFAMSKLREAGESTTIARAHAAWFATVADDADDRYHHVSIIAWLREFGIEIENARAALTWALAAENGDDALLAARIAGGLRSIWTLNERRAECRRWTEAALARVDAHRHPKIVARLMRGLVASCDGRALVDAANRAIPHCERIGDRLGLMALHGNMAREYALEGAVAESLRSADRAFGLLNEQDAADARWHVQLLQLRCFIHVYAGDLEAARGDLSRKTTIEASLGEGPSLAQFYMEALLAFAEGNARQSAELLDACVEHAATNAIGRATPLCDLAAARLVAGEVEAAGFAARESLELARFDELGTAWRAISHLATVAALRGRPEPAARLDGFLCAWCAAQHRVRGPYESASRELLTASLREQLSAEAVIRLAKEGAAFPFGHAVDEAFGA